MDWSNERYIRLYTRDTGDWLMWPWQTRALFVFILRKVDRAGLLHLGKGQLNALAAIVGMPSQDVTEWIAPLVEDGCVQIRDGILCVPNFIAAQEVMQSDRARQRASRERARDKFVAATGREPSAKELRVPTGEPSQCVTFDLTSGHVPSHAVTFGHSEPSLADPNQTERETPAPARDSSVKLKSIPPPPPESVEPEELQSESGYDLAKRVFADEWRAKYREPYDFDFVDAGPESENRVLQGLGGKAKERGDDAERWLRHVVKAYLRDRGHRDFLVGARHSAKFIRKSWQSYGNPPKSANRVRAAQPAEPVAPALSPAEVAAKLAASCMGKIGTGGTR